MKAHNSGDGLLKGHEAILFVDDESAVEEVARRMLDRLGYQVTTRASGEEALALFRADPDAFDLVITDMTMPGMSGADLARELMRVRPGIPIILSTGFSEELTSSELRDIGIRALLTKPLTLKDFAETVRRVIDG
ncbi:MAG: response regulator [Desulfobacterales bacterium]